MSPKSPPRAPESPLPNPSTEARGAKRFFHVLLAFAGWVLFIHWWWIVFRRVSAEEIRFTLLFIVFALVVILATTGFWVLHNRALFQRKGPRLRAVESTALVMEDATGRHVRFVDPRPNLVDGRLVHVEVGDGEKLYSRGPLELP